MFGGVETDVELSGAIFKLWVEHGRNMYPVVFAVEKFGACLLYSGVCGCCEVLTMSLLVELEIVMMWYKCGKWIVAIHMDWMRDVRRRFILTR